MNKPIQIIVLSNGDKVIGEMGSYDKNGTFRMVSESKILVKNPFILKEIMTQEGYSLLPMPLLPTSDDMVYINEEHIVVYPCNLKEEIIDMYRQMTSNILIPTHNKIQTI
jgi:hypothetical protein